MHSVAIAQVFHTALMPTSPDVEPRGRQTPADRQAPAETGAGNERRAAPTAGMPLAGQVLNFGEGRQIYAEGDTVHSFYKVMGGVVRTCRFTSDGRRQIDGFHGEGEIFGLETGGEHRLAAEAVTDCCVVAYRWSGLSALAGSEADMARTVFHLAMSCFERAQEHALLLGRRSAAQKLAAFLLDLGGRGSDNAVDLAMTRQDIADYLNLTIETVSRTLSQFERDHLIALPSSRHVVLRNPVALRSLVD